MKHIYYILFSSLLLLTSCSEERAVGDSVQRLDISFADTRSRSNWSDLTDNSGDKKVVYVWENDGDNMLTAIKHSDKYVPFYESMTSVGEYYTKTRFETVNAEKSKITLHTVNGVKLDVAADGNYEYPVTAGDAMYCFHPINSNTTVTGSADAVTVDMKLPSTFSYNELSNDLTPLAEYSYVYTSTTLQSVDANEVVAVTSHFNSACAIIRFNVTNSVTSDIIITGIKMESDDGSQIFPNVLRFADGKVAEQADKSSYYSRLSTVGSVTIPRKEKGVFYNMSFPLDESSNFNNVPLKFTIDTNYLTYQLRLNSGLIPNNKFEAGKIYTFNFTLQEKEIMLNTIDISQCTTYNIDSSESLSVIVSPDAVWDQSGNETAQMVFVSLGMSTKIDGQDYEVLWATCNLGAMEPIETGFHYAWGEVERKGASEYSPKGYKGTATTDIMGTEHDAVKAYLGEGYWLWRMPTQQMWQDIIDNCNWKWKTVKKATDGGESEDNLNFDASVWEVTKKDANSTIVGLIYLPITGYSGKDETTGEYKKVNKARCHYWTSTPCSGEATSWAFETTYYTESGGTGNGHMTAPVLKECERYNGYCIRPVLLKRKN